MFSYRNSRESEARITDIRPRVDGNVIKIEVKTREGNSGNVIIMD